MKEFRFVKLFLFTFFQLKIIGPRLTVTHTHTCTQAHTHWLSYGCFLHFLCILIVFTIIQTKNAHKLRLTIYYFWNRKWQNLFLIVENIECHSRNMKREKLFWWFWQNTKHPKVTELLWNLNTNAVWYRDVYEEKKNERETEEKKYYTEQKHCIHTHIRQ